MPNVKSIYEPIFELSVAELAKAEADALASAKRQMIGVMAGDQSSILGTTSDAVHLLLFYFAQMAAAVAAAKNIEDIAAAAAPFAALTAEFLANVEGGQTVLPFHRKQDRTIVTEIENRATAVAGALKSFAPGANETVADPDAPESKG